MQTSFVRLGPIRHMEGIDRKRVLVYNWLVNPGGGLDFEKPDAIEDVELGEISNDIGEILTRQESTEKFNFDSAGHLALLVFELLKIFIALTKSEISDLLAAALGRKLSENVINRIIFLLDKFELAHEQTRGHYKFFLLKNPDLPSRVETPGLIHSSARIDALAYYRSELNSVNIKRKLIIPQGASF